jgi:ribosomal protein S18 acetylase RimI-like enzyme
MQIRCLEASDASAFQALRLQALRECPSSFASSYEEECDVPISTVAERLAPTPTNVVFGAFQESALVGTVGLARERHRKLAHKAIIWGVYVAPASRKLGLGRQLMDQALRHAASIGVRQVILGVNSANTAATRLYQSLGFQDFGLERGFMLIDGQLYDEIHMVRVLDSAVGG